MPKLVRMSISLEEPLAQRMEKLINDCGYANRSEFVRDLVRDRLVEEDWKAGNAEVIATITLVYDHHKRELSEKLTDIQHHHFANVLAATHLHLNENMCAEMIMVKGEPAKVKDLVYKLRQNRGVLHSGVAMSATGANLD